MLLTHAGKILDTHPRTIAVDASPLLACIEACFDCAQSCTACADACLGEDDVRTIVSCIRVCHDCADQCTTTGRVLTRQTEFEPTLARRVVETCAEACRVCADACERHAERHKHCAVCAEACRHCEDACSGVAALLWGQAAHA
jgi:hypothetical protein